MGRPTTEQVIAQLTELGADFDPTQKYTELYAQLKEAQASEPDENTVDTEDETVETEESAEGAQETRQPEVTRAGEPEFRDTPNLTPPQVVVQKNTTQVEKPLRGKAVKQLKLNVLHDGTLFKEGQAIEPDHLFYNALLEAGYLK